MSDISTTDTPDEPVRGPDATQPSEASALPSAPSEPESSAPWSPATDANVRAASEEAPRERVARERTKDRSGDRHANPRPAKDRGGDAPLRRRPPAVEAAPPEAEPPDEPEAAAVAEAVAVPEAVPATPDGERIAKAIARAGLASRRDAEAMIAEGRVTLNGRVLDSPAINVTDDDAIAVDGEPLPARERTRLWVFHKPRGLVTTARDPEGRQTVFEAMPEEMPRVVAIGRLDINTEGLLLLTNDGGLAKVIAHPDTGWLRRYRVRAYGDITQGELDRLRKGVTIDGMEYGPVEASLDRATGDNVWLTLGLREGKNREVKRILEHLGLSVNRLIRLSFGPFQLGDLEVGLTEEIRTKVLKEQLGKGLSEQAGVDFESPVREPIAPFGAPKKAESPRGGDHGQGERPRRDDAPRGRASAGGRPTRPAAPARVPTGGMGAGPRRSVWRADAAQAGDGFRPSKVPRRGADPKAERAAAAAERGRERVGAIQTGERRVLVERLSASPAAPVEEAPQRRYARDANGAKPQRRRDDRDGPETQARETRGAERPYKPRFDEGAERAGPRTDRGGFRNAGDDRPREPRGGPGARGQGERRDGGRPEGRRFEGPKPGSGFGAKPSGGFGGKPSGGFNGKPGGGGGKPFGKPSGGRPADEREGGYKGRVEGAFKPRAEGGYKGRSEAGPARGAEGGRPAGKPGGFGAKPSGGFGGKPGGFGGRPGGRPGGSGGKPGGFGAKPGGGRPPRSGGR